MGKWNSPKNPPPYMKHKDMLIAREVIVRHEERQDKESGWPDGVGIGHFTVHTKEWRLQGCNYACKITGWMYLPERAEP